MGRRGGGGWQIGGGEAKFTPLLKGGGGPGQKGFTLDLGKKAGGGGGGQKVWRLISIILGFFLPEPHDI